MTLKELVRYYKNGYQFSKQTGFSHASYYQWHKIGYIPIKSQFKIEKLTDGRLKANIAHTKG